MTYSTWGRALLTVRRLTGISPALDGRAALAAIQLVCGTILGLDVGLELHANWMQKDGAEQFSFLHLSAELFATFLLFVAFVLSYRHLREHRAAQEVAETRVHTLRGDFSRLVDARFAAWGLSPSETEIALLTLKGLRIAEIARLRDCREGTIKSHLGAIFRKSGVTSRPEFLAKFVDDFLDFAAQPDSPPPTG